MSHFAAAVILKDINDLESALAPYQENNMGDCPKEYLEFHSTREENKERYETYTRTMYREEGILYRSDEDIFKKEIPTDEYHPEYIKMPISDFPISSICKIFAEKGEWTLELHKFATVTI